MREFLVRITTDVPADVPREEVDRLRAAEAVRAAELAATGHLGRLWRPVGELTSVGLWRAADEEELRAKVLDTLPLHAWMTSEVTPLTSHPNDPHPEDAQPTDPYPEDARPVSPHPTAPYPKDARPVSPHPTEDPPDAARPGST